MRILLFCFVNFWIISAFAQIDECTGSKELYRGRHKIDGMHYGHPYTIFDRRNGLTFEQTLQQIRKRIIQDYNKIPIKGPVYQAYQTLYNNATTSIPTNNGDNGLYRTIGGNKDHTQLATWAKNNAFVFLIGLDATGQPLDTTGPNAYAARNVFRDKALQGFNEFTGKIEHMNLITMSWHMEDMQFYSTALTGWAECYDLLKAAYEVPELRNAGRNPYGFGDADRNNDRCSPRNKLRKLTRDFYWQNEGILGVIYNPYGWKKNHGIKAAGAILIAAQVLNDAGVETNHYKGLFGWLWGDGFNLPRPHYSPINWNKLGYEGFKENLFEGKHWWPANNVPQSPKNTTPDQFSPYAEGPHYLRYCVIEQGIPAMRAQANLYPSWATEVLLNKPEIKNIFNWYDEILNQDGFAPSYDNSVSRNEAGLTLTGNPKFYYGHTGAIGPELAASFVAIVGGNGLEANTEVKRETENLADAGNLILRGVDSNYHHQLTMLNEKGAAIDRRPHMFDGTHEEFDYGSFMLQSQGTDLAIDPNYFGWSEKDKTKQFYHHNVVYFREDDGGVAFTPTEERYSQFNRGFQLDYLVSLKADFNSTGFEDWFYNLWNLNWGNDYSVGRIRRGVKSFSLANGNIYFVLTDKGTSDENEINGLHFRLNGNGFKAAGTFTNDSIKHINIWKQSCPNLIHHYAIQNNSDSPSSSITFNTTLSKNHGINGNITQFNVIRNNRNAVIQSILLPTSNCNSSASMPEFFHNEHPNFVVNTIKSQGVVDTICKKLGNEQKGLVSDTVFRCHFAQPVNDNMVVYHPLFDGFTSHTLNTNASNASFARGTFELYALGSCTNSINKFKEATAFYATFLKYNDTSYITSSGPYINADYKLQSKFKYEAYADPLGNSNTWVSFYLPDAETGFEMTARIGDNEILNTYTDSTKTINVNITGPTHFSIELKDLCQADCFFPPTAEPIDTTLYFNTGTKEVLAHDLDIIQPGGHLVITKGSKMSICPDFVFNNKDSLTLFATEEDKTQYAYANVLDGGTTISQPVRQRIGSKRSMIIVNNRAALVLDSGSFTHVGDNSTILVLKGGTLLIRKGAKVEIGGHEAQGEFSYGEIIAEEGAFVCIEDSTDIYFYQDTTVADSFDNNVFYVSLNKDNPTRSTVNPNAGLGKFTTLNNVVGIYANSVGIGFCNYKLVRPPHGIQNRVFGWCNFSKPYTYYTVPSYICLGIPIKLSQNKVLNETSYHLEVFNSLGQYLVNEQNTQLPQTIKTRYLPAFTAPDTYGIKLITQNDCLEKDTFTASVTVSPPAVSTFALNQTGCEGIGGVSANGSASVGYVPGVLKHVWYAQQLDSVEVDGEKVEIPNQYTQEWLIENATQVDSNFNFPNFYWRGGHRYIIGLLVHGLCSDTTFTDTITIPLGVKITAKSIKSTHVNLGTFGVELNAAVSGNYTGFNWYDANLLINSSTLTPTTTSDADSTYYTITVYNNSCTASDTIMITHKSFVNLGADSLVCIGDTVLIGNKLESSLLLGMLYYINPNCVSSLSQLDVNLSDFKVSYDKYLYASEYGYLESHIQNRLPLIWLYYQQNKHKFYSSSHYKAVIAYYHANTLADFFDYFEQVYLVNNLSFKHELDNFITYLETYYLLNNTTLEDEINLYVGNFNSDFETWYNNSGNTTVNTSWSFNNQVSNNFDNRFMITLPITQTTQIGLLVTNQNKVEYDMVTYEAEQALTANYATSNQTDSTLTFYNYTNGNAATLYTWYFGDGDSSNKINPTHTFKQFNKTYWVCLVAKNSCGIYSYCDSVRVDSNGTYGKRGSDDFDPPPFTEPVKQQTIKLANQNFLGNNYPNPFNGQTQIDYELMPTTCNNAKIVLSNQIGQVVKTINLYGLKGSITLEKENLQAGMYYYSLVVDEVKVANKIMVIK